jgi:hypothetical protein
VIYLSLRTTTNWANTYKSSKRLLVLRSRSSGQIEEAPGVWLDPTGVRQQPTLHRLVEPMSGALLLYLDSAPAARTMPFAGVETSMRRGGELEGRLKKWASMALL